MTTPKWSHFLLLSEYTSPSTQNKGKYLQINKEKYTSASNTTKASVPFSKETIRLVIWSCSKQKCVCVHIYIHKIHDCVFIHQICVSQDMVGASRLTFSAKSLHIITITQIQHENQCTKIFQDCCVINWQHNQTSAALYKPWEPFTICK